MDDCRRSRINVSSKSEPLGAAGALPIYATIEERQLCSIQETSNCQAGPAFQSQLRMESNDSTSNAVKFCTESEEGKKLPANKLDRMDLKKYLKSLLELSNKASENSASYTTVAPHLKKHLASFKTIFGKYQTSAYCDDATYIYVKLLKTFQLYDPESVYNLYNDWRVMLSSFKSISRAETFVDCFRRFKQIVQYLQSAENRWTKLMILSILRLYTYDVTPMVVRALQSRSGCDFLQVIQKIVALSNDQETPLKSHNTLLTSINSETGLIHSFQPNKIVCNGEDYNLADFELWIDWNVCSKVVSFMAMSATTDNSKDICGFTSANRMRIVSHQNSVFIRSKWALATTRYNPKSFTIEISFLFSARIHTAILESDLRNVFKIAFVKEISPGDNDLAGTHSEDCQGLLPNNQANNLSSKLPSVTKFVERKTEATNAQDSSTTLSNIEIKTSTESTQRSESAMERTVEATTRYAEIQKVQDAQEISGVATSMAKTSDYFAQSSQCHDEDSTGIRLRKTYWKRRSHQFKDEPCRKRIRTEPLKESLGAKTIRSSTLKSESTPSKKQYSRPSTNNLIAVHEQNLRNRENIEKRLTNFQLGNATDGQNFNRNSENDRADEPKPNEMKIEKKERFPTYKQHKPKSNALRRKKFDQKVWSQKWSIRKYFLTIPTDPGHVDEVVHNVLNEENDQMNIDSYYGSVSDVCGRA